MQTAILMEVTALGVRANQCPWDRKAVRLLRMEMSRRGLKHADVVRLLSDRGHVISVSSLRNKLSRGTFSAGFLFRILDALECQQIDVTGI